MNFVTLDFETAQKGSDPCEIGLTFVKNDKVAMSKSWLIKPSCFPHFDQSCVSVHGITSDDVKHSPEFPDIWKEVFPLIRGNLVFVHNTSFDIDVLCQTLVHYGMEFPALTYGCTLALAQKVFPPPRYNKHTLDYLCNALNIPLKQHRAAAESRATAELALIMFRKHNIGSEVAIQEKFNITLGQMTATGHQEKWPDQKNEEIELDTPLPKKLQPPKAALSLYAIITFTFQVIYKTILALFRFVHFSAKKVVAFEKEHKVLQQSASKVRDKIVNSFSADHSPNAHKELPVRQWTSADGKHSIEARLIEVAENTIRLQKIDGSTIDVPFTNLSQEDADWAKNSVKS
jgi:DNA polymerase-3 subunit epsilon